MNGTINRLCECNGLNCSRSIDLPIDVVIELTRNGHIIIADGCKNGPFMGDILVEKRNGYRIFKEKMDY